MDHIFFIYSSVDGHLGCFHVFAIVNSAVMNTGVHITFIFRHIPKWQPTPVFLPGKSHGRRSLVGYCPWSRRESDTTEQLHFHFSLSSSGPRCVRTLHYEESWVALHGMAYSFTELCKPLCHDKAVIHDTVNE